MDINLSVQTMENQSIISIPSTSKSVSNERNTPEGAATAVTQSESPSQPTKQNSHGRKQ